MRVVKEIDLTKELSCVNFFSYMRDILSNLSDGEYIKIIVKGYAETFTIIEWLKSMGYHIVDVFENDGKSIVITG